MSCMTVPYPPTLISDGSSSSLAAIAHQSDGRLREMSPRHHSVLRAVTVVTGLLLVACQASDGVSTSPTVTRGLVEGELAPSFELPAADGGDVRLSDYLGERPVLLYFSMGPG